MHNFSISKDAFGNLQFIDQDGATHEKVRIIRAFPISDPDHGFAIVDDHGHEVAWFEDLNALPEEQRTLAAYELSQVEFIPVIERILNLNTFALPSIWDIKTDLGNTRLKLKSEQDIRRVSAEGLLITDANGIQYLIRDKKAIDKFSRKVLDRFL